MNNTVLIKSKGMGAGIILTAFARGFDTAHLKQISPRWWQNQVRYELRLQNVTARDIAIIYIMFADRSYEIEIF